MRGPGRSFVTLVCLACVFGVSQAGDPAAELSVLTLNTWHGLRSGESRRRFPGEDSERQERRLAWQLEQIRRLDPDLILLQEVNPNQRRARWYARSLGYDEIHKVTSCGIHLGPIKVPSNINEGLAILARPELALRRVGSKRLSGNALCSASWGFQTKESRYALFGAVEMEGRPVLVVTTHLSAPPAVPDGFTDDVERVHRSGELVDEQVDEILGTLERKRSRNLAEAERLIDEIARFARRVDRDDPPPVILGGDFNATPTAPSVQALRSAGFEDLSEGVGLVTWDPGQNRANFEIGSRRGPGLPTFGVARLEAALARARSRPRQIDYLFASEQIVRESIRRVLDEPDDGIYPSDHFGVLARVSLRGPS